MSDYNIRVHDFEGPLDLLIHLIEKNKVDIYDIPIVDITEQYIALLHSLQEFDIEGASEFLVMAATLLQIKSRMLLPSLPDSEEGDEEDPRRILVEMLVEYRRAKQQGKVLDELLRRGRRRIRRAPFIFPGSKRRIKQVDSGRLQEVLLELLAVKLPEMAFIERQSFNVADKMKEIEEALRTEDYYEFGNQILRSKPRDEIIALFLAVLELLRLKVIIIRQAKPFATIYIFPKGEEQDVL